SCRKDNSQPRYMECQCEINGESESFFGKDAEYLAVDYSRSDSTLPEYGDVMISPEFTQFYLGKLSAIYNEAKDTSSELHDVLFKYDVHSTPNRRLNQLSIAFTPEDLTIKNQFSNTPDQTDNAMLNDFSNVYGFNVIS